MLDIVLNALGLAFGLAGGLVMAKSLIISDADPKRLYRHVTWALALLGLSGACEFAALVLPVLYK